MPIGPRFNMVYKPFVVLLNYAQFFVIMLQIVLIYTWIGKQKLGGKFQRIVFKHNR